jgi:serine-type D-Ala-D-Ala carboxypeptidase
MSDWKKTYLQHCRLRCFTTKLPTIAVSFDTDRSPSTEGAPHDVLARVVETIAGGADAPPGVCLAVSHEGRVDCAARGVAQRFDDAGAVDDPAPMNLETRSDLGSVTKLIATTTALMTLVDAGELTLETHLWEILPWIATAPCAAATIAQLLEHRAGLWEWWPLYLSASDPATALHTAANLPLRYRPDQARHYSDLGFILLGAVVAEVGGGGLDDVVAELVLGPVGLSATRYGEPVGGAPVAASSTGDRIERRMIETGDPYPVIGDAGRFSGWRQHVLVGEVNDGNAFHALDSIAGHAGLFSSATDLLRFGDATLAALAGSGLATSALVGRFLSAGADPGQGLGWRRWDVGPDTEAWGHTGFPGVAVGIVPALGATVALVTNRLHVPGVPRATEPIWELALRAARDHCLKR